MQMPHVRTVFLATDGRHTPLGRGGNVDIQDSMIARLRSLGRRGWVAILSGDYYGNHPVALSRVHGVEGATDGEWAAAVTAFMAERERKQT